jgi:hypothetical protein
LDVKNKIQHLLVIQCQYIQQAVPQDVSLVLHQAVIGTAVVVLPDGAA